MNPVDPGWCTEQAGSRRPGRWRGGTGQEAPAPLPAPARTPHSSTETKSDSWWGHANRPVRCGAQSRGLVGKDRHPALRNQIKGNKECVSDGGRAGGRGMGSCQQLIFHRKRLPVKPALWFAEISFSFSVWFVSRLLGFDVESLWTRSGAGDADRTGKRGRSKALRRPCPRDATRGLLSIFS